MQVMISQSSGVASREYEMSQPGLPGYHSCCHTKPGQEMKTMFMQHVRKLWSEQEGQDIAEYAVMLAVILVIVVGTIRLIGSNANNVFSNVASSIQ